MTVTDTDAAQVDDRVREAARDILHARLGPLRISGVSDIVMQWTAGGSGKSRLVAVRYHAAKRRVTARLMIVPEEPFGPSYVNDMGRLTIGVLALIVNRLALRGTTVDLSRAANAIARDFAALARRAHSDRA